MLHLTVAEEGLSFLAFSAESTHKSLKACKVLSPLEVPQAVRVMLCCNVHFRITVHAYPLTLAEGGRTWAKIL